MSKKNIGVIGGGIIGLATAYKLQLKYPQAKIHLFEKEKSIGQHQSGRNSGVLHCGLPYVPGSLKAKLAVDGIRQMITFCKENNVEHDICGKVVVAANEREDKLLKELAKKGELNGLKGLKILTSLELKRREPHVRAYSSLLVPEEGIVDYTGVMETLSRLIREREGDIHLGETPTNVHSGKRIVTNKREVETDFVIFCTGLHSDRTYSFHTNKNPELKIVPFRGEYFKLAPHASDLVQHLIYPVPDPKFPFLGVHFTRMMNGSKEVGPNAVLVLKREGYTKGSFNFKDAYESLSYRGLHSFILKNSGYAFAELMSSISKKSFLQKAKKLVPDISEKDMVKGPAGIRAQAMSREGKLIMDFKIVREGAQIHVLNAPSPGATASLAIADSIIDNYTV